MVGLNDEFLELSYLLFARLLYHVVVWDAGRGPRLRLLLSLNRHLDGEGG